MTCARALGLAASLIASAVTAWADQMTVNSGGTLTANAGASASLPAGSHSFASGATLTMSGSSTINFAAAGGTLTVSGSFNASGATPTVTGAASGDTNLQLIGATVNVTGMNYSNGVAAGLTIGGGATITAFNSVAFTSGSGTHLDFTGASGQSMVCVACSFDGPPASGSVKCDNAGAVVVLTRFSGAGQNSTAAGSGTVTWIAKGDQITTNPGSGEASTGYTTGWRSGIPVTSGVQGGLVAQYNWYSGNFINNYVLCKQGSGTSKLVAIGSDGAIRYSYTIDSSHTGGVDPGQVVVNALPTTATLGDPAGPYAEVVMFDTTNGFIFVVQDTGAALTDYTGYPKQPRDPSTYTTVVCQTAFCPLLFDPGADGVANGSTDTDDNFYLTGSSTLNWTYASGFATNNVYKTKCWNAGAQAQCVSGWPLGYNKAPARSWPGYQVLNGTIYLHIATDDDIQTDDATASHQAHIYRVNASAAMPSIEQDYSVNSGTNRPGNHCRGGMQFALDPIDPNANYIYIGCYQDQAGDNAKFFSINSTSISGGTYKDQWTPFSGAVGADIECLADYDSTQIVFGDSAGVLHALSRSTGAETANFPVTLEAGQAIRCFPVFPTAGSSFVYVGNDNGKVFKVNTTTGAKTTVYDVGAGRMVRSLSFFIDATNNTFLGVITSDGYEFLVAP